MRKVKKLLMSDVKMPEESNIIPPINPEKTIKTISNFIKNKKDESKTEGLVIGLSGGLDSSTAAYISVKAVDKDKILGLIMPSQTTTPEDFEDAVTVAKCLEIEYEVIPIDNLIKPFVDLCIHSTTEYYSQVANANLKARIRMMILYYHANSMNRLVVGTGNLSELLIGYFTKYGDGGVDMLPLGDLYKTDVKKIAHYLQLPKEIMIKAPTAGLWLGQTDEEELGIKYHLLDEILYLVNSEKLKYEVVAEKLEIPKEEVLRIKNMMKSAEHKITSPPIPKIR